MMRFDKFTSKNLLEIAGVDTTKGAAKALVEKWEHEAHINPEKKGMFAGRSKESLEAELKHLRDTGPHHEGSPEFTKEKELSFAIRAKSGWGEEEQHSDEEDCSDMMAPMAGMEQEEEWGVKHTGRNTNKSVAELEHERAKARERGDTTAVKQKNFAIRAKTGWGKA